MTDRRDWFRELSRFSRRDLLRILGTLGLAGAAEAIFARRIGAQGRDARPRPPEAAPNVVFILSDDHRADFMGVSGHPFIRTPSMDRIAREGVWFRNAFTTTSLCSPSRGSFLTGMYASRHGCRNNLMTMDRSRPTFPEILARAGYDSAVIGKWHMPGPLPKLEEVDPFITFTLNAGQGRYFDCPLVRDGKTIAPRHRHVDEDFTEYAFEFLGKKRDRPFCLYLAFKSPHHDWRALPPFEKAYEDTEIPMPSESDPWLGFTDGNTFLGTNRFLPGLVRDYCRAITSADFLIGRVLERIDAMGAREDTVVIYAGDNGYLWGEHRLVDKRWAYEDSIRIPFLVRYPKAVRHPGHPAGQMVLNVDVAPTLLDLAGLPIPDWMQGRSLAPILASREAPGREAWLYEHFPDYPYPVPRIRAARTPTRKYVEYEGGKGPELYDLAADPRERRNLIGTGDGAAVLPRMKGLLASLRREIEG